MSTQAAGAPIGAPRDKPWIFRTYAGHSTAGQSNRLFRANLAKGQTGLSIAFDLPTQTGYDCDHPLAKGEVGKVGVPIGHIGDMRRLFEANFRQDRAAIAEVIKVLTPVVEGFRQVIRGGVAPS